MSVRARIALRFTITVEVTCALLFASHLVADMCATWTRHGNRRPRQHTLRRKLSRLERVCCCGVLPAYQCFTYTIPTLSQHYPNFVSTLSQKFELSTQRKKLISYENGMVLYYSNNTRTMNKYIFNCIYI